MNVYQWLCVFGVPSLFAGLVGFIFAQIKANRAMKNGIQAMLRDRLLQSYRYHAGRGFAEPEERQSFIAMYNGYHALGANGVMDDIKDKMLSLPVYKDIGGNKK